MNYFLILTTWIEKNNNQVVKNYKNYSYFAIQLDKIKNYVLLSRLKK